MKIYPICILISFFALLSCRSTKKEISNLEKDLIPAQWNSGFEVKSTDRNVTYWTDSFEIPPLTRLISQANQNNPELASMYERMVAKGEDATIGGANLLPAANANVTADIYSLVNKVSGYKDEYRGFIFRVKDTDSTLFSESQQLREVLYTVYNSHVPYTDTNFNEIQLPLTRENQIFNRLDIASVDELTRYAGVTNTVMTNNTRYKYYGFEIIKALNDSIVTLNIANDISPLMCQIENIIGYESQDAPNMPIINIENTINYISGPAIDMTIPDIGNVITAVSRNGVTNQFTSIENTITYATQNTALTKVVLRSVIEYTSLPAIAL